MRGSRVRLIRNTVSLTVKVGRDALYVSQSLHLSSFLGSFTGNLCMVFFYLSINGR